MGNRRILRQKFFAEHRYCCFCGGTTPSKEEDHFPSRALFDDRKWPEGYVFPACEKCNRISRKEETIVAFLSRLYSKEFGDGQEKDLEKYAKSIEYNYPGLLKEMLPNARQARTAIKKYSLLFPAGQAKAEIPLLWVSNPIINNAVIVFGRKLLLALYYKHAGTALSPNGGIALRWYTNLQASCGEMPLDLGKLLPGIPVLKRCNSSLGDQFFYKYGLTECKGGAAFLIGFRQSFTIAGFVYSSKNRLLKNKNVDKVYAPFNAEK